MFASCLVVLLLASAWAEPPRVKQVEEKLVIPFVEGRKGKTLDLKKVRNRFDTPNSIIGELQKGWFCEKSGDIVWSKKLYSSFSPKLGKVFREELEAAFYPVSKASDAIFDTTAESNKSTSDLHVGMMIKDVKANFCVKTSEVQGGVYMKIFWQVFSPESQKVVFETTTEGTYQPKGYVKNQLEIFFLNSFRVTFPLKTEPLQT